jgi:multidrug efflux system membrane fusion protein
MPRFSASSVPALAVVTAALLASGCSKAKPPAKRPVPVTVATAQRGAVPYLVIANGAVEPINTVSVQSQVTGVLTQVFFKEGDDVAAGQKLFQIDSRQYEADLRQAQAVLARDEAQAANAKRDAERYAALVSKDYVTKAQADQAAAAAAAQQAVVEADRAAVESARLNVEYCTITAPISGRTGSLLVRAGNLLRGGTSSPLVVINQIRPIRVRFAVPQAQLPDVQRYVKKGTIRVRVTPNGGGAPIEGGLSFLENAVDSTTGTVALKAEFPNTDAALWPGEFVMVEMQLFLEPNAVTVPADAVLVGQNGSYVFVIGPDSTARVQPVESERTVKDVAVISKGIDAGMLVVTDGQSRLEPGSKVDIKSSQGPSERGVSSP